jgi:putative peptidoglycan lipid II flippase
VRAVPARWSVPRAAALVAALTAGSTLLGLARDIVIAGVYGAGADLDAYLVAQGLMNIVLGLVAGAMAKAAVPAVAREAAAEAAEGERSCRGHAGFDVALTMTLVVLGLASVVMALLAAPIVAVLAPGFSGAQAETAVQLTRIVLVATVLIAGTNLLAALAQAHGRFGWSALQGIPFNLVMIVAAAGFGPRYGIVALAVGFVAGSAARLVAQLPPLRSLGTRVRLRWQPRAPGFAEIVRLVPPLLLGSAIGNVNTLVDRAVGSTLTEGSITALSYGWRLVTLPETLLIASLMLPLYPAMGAAAGDPAQLRRLVGRGLSVAVTLLTPLCVALVVVAAPAVATAFGYGSFDGADVAATATAVAWYAPALLALGCREVVVQASYARGDARAPVTVAVVAMLVNVAGDLTLGLRFGVPGVAASTTLSLVVAAAANTWLLRRRHRAVAGRAVAGLALRAAGLAVTSALAGAGVRAALAAAAPALHPAVVTGAVGLVVVGAYALGLIVLRAPERALTVTALRAVRRRG